MNEQNNDGETALHKAAYFGKICPNKIESFELNESKLFFIGREKVVELLLAFRANRYIQNYNDAKPRDIALARGNCYFCGFYIHISEDEL